MAHRPPKRKCKPGRGPQVHRNNVLPRPMGADSANAQHTFHKLLQEGKLPEARAFMQQMRRWGTYQAMNETELSMREKMHMARQ